MGKFKYNKYILKMTPTCELSGAGCANGSNNAEYFLNLYLSCLTENNIITVGWMA